MPLCFAIFAVLISLLLAACEEEDQAREPSTEHLERESAPAINRVYLGVSCPEPNSIRCDTVRLSVSLHEPAQSVRASIGGRSFPLELGGCLPPQGGRNFCGPLHPAGLSGKGQLGVDAVGGRWIGNPPVRPRVLLTIRDRDGDVVTRGVRTQLRAGFG